jgi:hypothetical protein
LVWVGRVRTAVVRVAGAGGQGERVGGGGGVWGSWASNEQMKAGTGSAAAKGTRKCMQRM